MQEQEKNADLPVYCGKKDPLPPGYLRNGTPYECLRKGFNVGKYTTLEVVHGGNQERARRGWERERRRRRIDRRPLETRRISYGLRLWMGIICLVLFLLCFFFFLWFWS